jgi:hypothetical protein
MSVKFAGNIDGKVAASCGAPITVIGKWLLKCGRLI